jgi:tRNA(Phe) wybutosine-synthesizing methylase Tyw3
MEIVFLISLYTRGQNKKIMLTKTEIENIIKQVNESFVEDRKRLTKLEAKVAELEKNNQKSTKKAEAA